MAEPIIKTEYHSLSEIAARFNKSVRTIRNWKNAKRKNPLPAFPVGNEWWLTEELIQDWFRKKACQGKK